MRISNRIGNRTTGLEAQQESELDEKTAAAHTRALELKGEEGKQERLTQTELNAKSVRATSQSRPLSPKPETTDFIMRQPNGKAGNVTHSIRELKQPPSDRTYEPYTRENAASKIKEWFPDISDEQLKTELDKVYSAESTETKEPSESDTGETKAEDEKVFQREHKDTDYLHKDADGKTYNVHAEVAYMINIDKWTRAQIKEQLKKDYPELEDSKIDEILNDPEFKYPVEN